MIRAFVALDVAPSLVDAAVAVAEILRKGPLARTRASWVKPERMHVTVRFLGDVDEAHVPAIADAVREAAASVPPFALRAERLDAFPSARRPRVLVVRLVGADDGASTRLASALDDALARLDPPFARETRPFVPHLTLARLKQAADVRAAAEAATLDATGDATALVLVKSVLSSEGPTYTTLARAPLGLA